MTAQNQDFKLTAVYGIGEQRAEQLIECGIETCYDLSEQDPQYVADVLSVSESDAKDYINDAIATVGGW